MFRPWDLAWLAACNSSVAAVVLDPRNGARILTLTQLIATPEKKRPPIDTRIYIYMLM